MSCRKDRYKHFCVGLVYQPKLLSFSRTDESLKDADCDEKEQLLKAEKSSSDEEVDETTKLKRAKETIM